MPYKMKHFTLDDNWTLDDWPDEVSVSHRTRPNVSRKYKLLKRKPCYNDSIKVDKFHCSECGIDLKIVKLSTEVDFIYVPNYCPECGSVVMHP